MLSARGLLVVLRHRWTVVLAILLPAALIGVVAVQLRPTTTTAVSVVGAAPETADQVSADAVRLALGRYAVALTSTDVIDEVAAATGLGRDEVGDAVSVSVSPEAGTLTIRVVMPEEETALEVTREVAAAAVQLGDDDALANASVLSGARVESAGPLASPRLLQAALVLAALLVALLVAFALEVLRPRVRTGGDAAEAAGGPVIGSLPPFVGPWPRRRVAPDSEILAAARMLRSGWAATTGTVPAGPVVVVGAGPGAGATTATFLLARALSDRGEPTVVLDLDLDRAGLTELMDLPGGRPLDDVVHERATLEESVVHDGTVSVLPAVAGATTDEALDRRLPDVLKQAADHWSVVLCDTVALGAGESSELVAAHAASAVVVVRLGSPVEAVERAAARLARLGVPVRGVVLNDASRDQAEQPALRRPAEDV